MNKRVLSILQVSVKSARYCGFRFWAGIRGLYEFSEAIRAKRLQTVCFRLVKAIYPPFILHI